MTTYSGGGAPITHAPSGSRLAQYMNKTSNHTIGDTSLANHYDEHRYNVSNYPESYITDGPSNGTYSKGYNHDLQEYGGGSASMEHPAHLKNDEYASLEQNSPHLLLQVTNESTLKQRWAQCGSSYFACNDLKTALAHRQMAQQCIGGSEPGLPESIKHFRSLRTVGSSPSLRIGEHVEHLYKAINVNDGLTYALHRVTNIRALNAQAAAQIENWRRLNHSNMARLHETVLTTAFNDSSCLFVYGYQPLAEPLLKHFFNTNGSLKQKYVVSCAIRTAHANSMAVRCIDLNRIVTTSMGRFLISGVGINDVLIADAPPSLLALQIEDLRMFGAVLLTLLSGSLQTMTQERLANVAQLDTRYSPDLRNIVRVLCHAAMSAPGRATSINEKQLVAVMPMIGARFYNQLEMQQIRIDMLENDMCKEMQNGRLFRLLGMLEMVCDRNLPHEPYWSETSERYMLKLFRDYVFHQVDTYVIKRLVAGSPVVDLAHIVLNLNKLDAGADEAVQLASRDNENVLLVTYKDLRGFLDQSFAFLRRESEAATGGSDSAKLDGAHTSMSAHLYAGGPQNQYAPEFMTRQ